MEKLLSKISGRESLLLAAIPFIGTYTAFVFEAGYLSFYDVPISFVKLDFTKIISASAAIVALSSYFYLAFITTSIIAKGDHPIRKAFVKPVFYTLFLAIIAYFLPFPYQKWWVLLVFLISLLALEFISPFFSIKQHGSYISALSNQINKDSEKIDNEEFKIKDVFGIIFLCSFMSLLYGNFLASEKSVYWSSDNHPDMIVVEIYGDNVLLKDFNRQSKEIGSKLEIINIAKTPNLQLTRVRLGKLIKKLP